jgi:hypothetical protein
VRTSVYIKSGSLAPSVSLFSMENNFNDGKTITHGK